MVSGQRWGSALWRVCVMMAISFPVHHDTLTSANSRSSDIGGSVDSFFPTTVRTNPQRRFHILKLRLQCSRPSVQSSCERFCDQLRLRGGNDLVESGRAEESMRDTERMLDDRRGGQRHSAQHVPLRSGSRETIQHREGADRGLSVRSKAWRLREHDDDRADSIGSKRMRAGRDNGEEVELRRGSRGGGRREES
eukprot:1414483-Rhodomonas_salina.1